MKLSDLALLAFSLFVFTEPASARSISRDERPDVDQATNSLQRRDYEEEDISPKYFSEADFDVHYDGRWADGRLPYDLHRSSLILLTQTCLSTFNDLGVEVWIMHGSLLGWYWNRRILPWDGDVDLQISVDSMDLMYKYYNLRRFRFRQGSSSLRRNYVLEINPNYVNGSTADAANRIDARWIDTDTGLFLDITAVRPDEAERARGNTGALMCKDGHRFYYDDIYPLRDTVFEGVSAKVPYNYADLLTREYNDEALTNGDYNGHRWDDEKKEWVPTSAANQWPQDTLSSFVPILEENARELGYSTKPVSD